MPKRYEKSKPNLLIVGEKIHKQGKKLPQMAATFQEMCAVLTTNVNLLNKMMTGQNG